MVKGVLDKALPRQSFSMKRGTGKLKESFGFTEGDNVNTKIFPLEGAKLVPVFYSGIA